MIQEDVMKLSSTSRGSNHTAPLAFSLAHTNDWRVMKRILATRTAQLTLSVLAGSALLYASAAPIWIM